MADTFTDNAFVQALGNHLGMTNLLSGDMGGAPDGGYGGGGAPQGAAPKIPVPPPPRPSTEGSKTPREFRQHAPVARQSSAKGSGGVNGLPLNLPGVMSPEVLMHPVVQGLLKQYGVDPTDAAQNADPNLFMGPEAFAKHPKIADLIERSLEGAAFTKPGDTIGENINNFAQGMLEAKAARANKYNNQLLMPFAQAQQVANLKSISDEQNFKQAQAKHYQDLEDHYNAMDETKARLADIQADRAKDLDEFHKGMLTVRNQMNMMKVPLDKAGNDE